MVSTSPEITPVVSHNIGMPAGLQDEDFLLQRGDIIVCEEHRREKAPQGEGKGDRSPGYWDERKKGNRVLGKPLSLPGSIFTIFSATRSPDTLSRAFSKGELVVRQAQAT